MPLLSCASSMAGSAPWTWELLNALAEAVSASDRALIITGTGSACSAGVDLRRILEGGRPYTEELLTALSRVFRPGGANAFTRTESTGPGQPTEPTAPLGGRPGGR
jgi:hypothetical protein